MKAVASILCLGTAATLAIVRPARAHHLQPKLRRRARHRAARPPGRRELRRLLRRDRAGGAGLRHPARPGGKHSLQILEQNYRNDPVSQELLLSLFEGKTIDFENLRTEGQHADARTHSRQNHPQRLRAAAATRSSPSSRSTANCNSPCPASRCFPIWATTRCSSPRFNWLLQSDKPGKFDAEVGYVTGGFDWSASYNLVSPEKGDNVDLVGWITMNNKAAKPLRTPKSNSWPVT